MPSPPRDFDLANPSAGSALRSRSAISTAFSASIASPDPLLGDGRHYGVNQEHYVQHDCVLEPSRAPPTPEYSEASGRHGTNQPEIVVAELLEAPQTKPVGTIAHDRAPL